MPIAVANSDAALAFIEIGAVALGLSVLARVASRLGITAIPLYLLAGLAVGRGGIAPLDVSADFIHLAGEIGVLLLGGVCRVSSSGVVSKVLADLGRLGNPETLAMALYLPVIGAVIAGTSAGKTAITVAIAVASLGAPTADGPHLGALAAAYVLITALIGPLVAKYADRLHAGASAARA